MVLLLSLMSALAQSPARPACGPLLLHAQSPVYCCTPPSGTTCCAGALDASGKVLGCGCS